MSENFKQYIPFAEKACSFLTDSPDPFFAVHNCVKKLESAGYIQLGTGEAFLGIIKPGALLSQYLFFSVGKPTFH